MIEMSLGLAVLMGFVAGALVIMNWSVPHSLVKPKCHECSEWVARVKATEANLKELQKR